uniref:Myc box-dependent-interacting protein 1 n=1 Tax=Eptatretus burgeri TaxID=7764 RepID=A0A8C4R876_EPTBU
MGTRRTHASSAHLVRPRARPRALGSSVRVRRATARCAAAVCAMADPAGKGSAGVFAKNAKKRITRAQEKVLQKLGKADETKDEQFEQLILNFTKQNNEGTHLQKELKGYLLAVKAMHESSRRLSESLQEIYEPEWYGKDQVQIIAQHNDELWTDFHQKLVDQALLTLDTYLGQFPDIKARISKRGRKLVDYDSARHHLESLQSAKKKDEIKIAKAEEDYLKAQKVFEEINIDLQEELPVLWSSRIGFYVNTFKNVAFLEENFHQEMTALNHDLTDIMIKLGEQHADKAFYIKGAPSDVGPLRIVEMPPSPPEPAGSDEAERTPDYLPTPGLASPSPSLPKSPSTGRRGPPVPPPPKLTPSKEMQQEAIFSLFDDNFAPDMDSTPQPKEETLLDFDFDPLKPDPVSIARSPSPMSQTLLWDLAWETTPEATKEADIITPVDISQPASPPQTDTMLTTDETRPDDEPLIQPESESEPEPEREIKPEPEPIVMETPVVEITASTPTPVESPEVTVMIPLSNEALAEVITDSSVTPATDDFPPGFLFKVQAQHDYTPLDADELQLNRGDTVLVVPFNTTDQDVGWLMGIKEADWLAHHTLDKLHGVFPENYTSRLE